MKKREDYPFDIKITNNLGHNTFMTIIHETMWDEIKATIDANGFTYVELTTNTNPVE